MENTAGRAIAIVGAGCVMPDAASVPAFWQNVKSGRYCISEVTPDRWDPALYYDPDHGAVDKSYSKIGGWVREHDWDPMKWRLALPPRVVAGMDDTQKWAISCTREALQDFGYPDRALDLDRTAVILGNAMAGEKHYMTALRVYFPEYAHELSESPTFAALPEAMRRDITREFHQRIDSRVPQITEDTMPGELSNCIAGRLANLFNLRGPNYVVDAACASAMAAITAAVEGLIDHHFDVAITGGVDRNMGASTFVKFCKIGALSATGTRPYAEGADGFVMGEGGAIFLLKRLADAERDGDKIYAVLRGIAGSSDGKGKGITAPNPIGQKLCIERAWLNSGLSPATVTLMEGHGTSTRVGDVVEVQSMSEVLSGFHLPTGCVALGSVKSNIGHLKSAAGAAGFLKAVLSLRDKILPPSVQCQHPNPEIDFAHSPLYVNTELRPWAAPADAPRRAGLSAFGFGGTNFHAVLEEYIPHRLNGNGKRTAAVTEPSARKPQDGGKAPLRGAVVIGAASQSELAERLRAVYSRAKAGHAPAPSAPAGSDLRAPERLAIDYADAAELASKSAHALKALEANQLAVWKALRAQGVFRGQGPAPKVAFLYTGQGSQYVNMLRHLRAVEPIVAETFAEADAIMTPLLGKPLSEFIFVDPADAKTVAQAEEDLRRTAITQPAVLATDAALTRLMAAYGIQPDMTMGHSLGEYGALEAAGALPFGDALEAVSARGREMTRVSMEDNGRMAAVFAPIDQVDRILKTANGYVVVANINSERQAVIGGASQAVEEAIQLFRNAGYDAVPLSVSHAFHTRIVAPASQPLRQVLQRLRLACPRLPIVTNVNGEFYPTGPDAVPRMLDNLAQQIACPVQFVKGLRTLYAAGARVFVEVGPKKALQGFAEDVLGDRADVLTLFTNHPKFGDVAAFNQALCGLYAAGLGGSAPETVANRSNEAEQGLQRPTTPLSKTADGSELPQRDKFAALGHLFAGVLERGWQIYRGGDATEARTAVTITGAALGLPGTERVFDDANIARILRGEQFIGVIPTKLRQAMLDKHVTRLVKNANGAPSFENIDDVADVIKLAGRGGAFDLESEFGVSGERVSALDRATRLAMAAGLDALRDAGIPLVLRYKTTSKGTSLPDRWGLPDRLRDTTGVIFACVFPGLNSFAEDASHYYADQSRREQLALLERLRSRVMEANGSSAVAQEIDRRIADLRLGMAKDPFTLDRRFLFRVLSMGHSQFAEFIGARGPNTQINSACASTTQAVSLAEDWIRAGRCRRVIVISADDITSDHLIDWFGAGFLASGAAATDAVVENTAVPFDRRRHGMIMGMGAAALVIESADAARERGIRPICEVAGAVTANSAFHGTRLSIDHIGQVMEELVAKAETHCGVPRHDMARRMVFVSHETYTPAHGGSAAAEIYALRKVFGDAADQIVIANTKGFTGHAMGAGIEDVVAVKALETGRVPPVANFKEVDPELGQLNLSKGGVYPIEFALRLGAGFGSQISMTLARWVPSGDPERPSPDRLGYAHRIADSNAWNAWLEQTAGGHSAGLEVVHRTLRMRDTGRMAMAQTAAAEFSYTPAPSSTDAPGPRTPAAPAAVIPEAGKSTAPSPVLTAALSIPVVKNDPVKERVLTLVSEKTGYPVDMLDPGLDLEADLGVDTVKQAEVFAAIREAYGITRDEQTRLRDFPTLAHVIRFVHERLPDPTVPAPAAVAVAAETPPRSVTPAPAPDVDIVKDRILALVVEKTGYPPEMLDLDLDLEADLGIDTVKQAEMMAAVREIYDIPRDENLKLRDFSTLARVIQFVRDRRPDLAQMRPAAVIPVPEEATVSDAPSAKKAGDPVEESVLALVVEKTGYPKDMLELDLDLEADLGIDTVKEAEMLASVRGIYDIPRDENLKLHDFRTLSQVIQFVRRKRPDLAGATPPPLMADLPLAPAPLALAPSAPAPATVEVSTETADPITAKVLEIVAGKTGYPVEMLDLDLDLEADLGIDTVKQAEMFASVRATFDIPRDQDLKLRDFPTLAHVIQFARDRRADQGGMDAGARPASSPPVSNVVMPARPIPVSLDAANRIPRRVPVPELRPRLTICKPAGVALSAGRRVVMMPDQGGVARALAERLESLGVTVLSIDQTLAADALSSQLQDWLSEGPIQGVYWLPALDNEGDLRQMDLATWRACVRVRLKTLYTTMQALYDQVAAAGTFLVSATRLGGHHGYDEPGALAPLGGAVTGFTKTYKWERPDALVKAVDFEAERTAAEIAGMLLDETLLDPGAVEIGYKGGLRWTIGLKEQAAADGQPGTVLDKSTVFVITGAAGSIVSAITADLAAASGGTFYLLDLVAEPDPRNPDLDRLLSDKPGLKRDLFARLQARGERATPALVEKELAALERAQAASSAIDAVRAAGGTAHYFSVNLTDPDGVAAVIDQIRQRSGRIDVLLHAAGVERSHFLKEKAAPEFDLVFDVKSDGCFNLLRAVGGMPLGAVVAFSSIAARFGNGGQTDYSSANDLLCKIISSFRGTRPATRGIAIDWTAWAEIGMATRGSIPKMMELAGIDMLPPEAGIPMVRRELTAGASRGEVLIGQRLGILLNEWDATGGLDTAATESLRGPASGGIAAMFLHGGLTVETTLDPAVQPFLYDHQIEGVPVLPGVMGIEAFGETARSLLPGWHIAAIEDVNFLAPFKFYRSEQRTLTVQAVFHPDGDGLVADCRLLGHRSLPNQGAPQVTTHFTGRVRLVKTPAESIAGAAPCAPGAPLIDAAGIYRLYFHGPAYRVLRQAWREDRRMVGQLAEGLPVDHHPEEQPMLMAPRLIELCFQTAGLWEMFAESRMGLPRHLDRVSLCRAPELSGGPLYAVVSFDSQTGAFDAEVVDDAGNRYVHMSGYRTVAFAGNIHVGSLKLLQPAAL